MSILDLFSGQEETRCVQSFDIKMVLEQVKLQHSNPPTEPRLLASIW